MTKSRRELTEFVEGHQDRRYNFDQLIVILSSLLTPWQKRLELGILDMMGHRFQGSQEEIPYDQVIIWPRQEGFIWA